MALWPGTEHPRADRRRERPCPSCACSAPALGRTSLTVSQGDAHPFAERVLVFAREGEDVAGDAASRMCDCGQGLARRETRWTSASSPS
jgi:hypothetical protein